MRLPEAYPLDVLKWDPCWGTGDIARSMLGMLPQEPFTALDVLTRVWPVARPPLDAGYSARAHPYDDLSVLRERLWIACHLLPDDVKFASGLSNLCDSISAGEVAARIENDQVGAGEATYYTLAYAFDGAERAGTHGKLQSRVVNPIISLLMEVQNRAPAGCTNR